MAVLFKSLFPVFEMVDWPILNFYASAVVEETYRVTVFLLIENCL